MTQLDADIAAFIASTWSARPDAGADGLPELVVGSNLFTGLVRIPDAYIPVDCVFVQATGGPAPYEYIAGADRPAVSMPQAQIRVRWSAEDYTTGQLLATAVHERVNLKRPSGYYDCFCLESHPIALGADGLGYYQWSINIEAWKEIL